MIHWHFHTLTHTHTRANQKMDLTHFSASTRFKVIKNGEFLKKIKKMMISLEILSISLKKKN